MQIEAIDGSFAREVKDIDLWKPVSDADRAAIRTWVLRSLVKRGIWGSGLDGVLTRQREAIRSAPASAGWPTDALEAAIRADAGGSRMAVVATAGTTNTGAVDPLEAIAALCAREGVWLHVDGAYGGAAVFGPESRARVAGIERADSLSLDPHKWLFTPYECGCALVRDRRHLRRAFDARADYLSDVRGDDESLDFQDIGFQLTRSFRALKVWATFQVSAPTRSVPRSNEGSATRSTCTGGWRAATAGPWPRPRAWASWRSASPMGTRRTLSIGSTRGWSGGSRRPAARS